MRWNLILVISASLFVVSCQPGARQQESQVAGPQAWVDAPLDGSTIPLAPYQIVAHASQPEGVQLFELTITSSGPETIPVPADQSGQTLVYINHTWTPPAPGTYLIQVRAAGPDGAYGPMAEAQVQVGGDVDTPTPASAL